MSGWAPQTDRYDSRRGTYRSRQRDRVGSMTGEGILVGDEGQAAYDSAGRLKMKQ